MKRRITVILIFLSFLSGTTSGQDTIPFFQNVYEEALLTAEQSNKPLMFYFYNEKCTVCNKVDSMFLSERLSQYFSLNFINVRVDYNQPMGIRLSNKYKVKSLPTIVFLDQKLEPFILMEEDFSSQNILKFARWTVKPASRDPGFQLAIEQKQKMKNWEKVDSVFDFTVIDNRILERETVTSLYNQSLMHKTLNDGLAEEHAIKYLQTQNDWTTEKNMRFIMDFVSDTRSDAFSFLTKNKAVFYELMGQESVDSLIRKLIDKRLYQLQPPPNYNETKELMRLLSPVKTDVRTYEYLIDLNLRSQKYVQYLLLERKYIKKFAPKDHERMIKMIDIYLEHIPEDYNAAFYLEYALTANKLAPNNIDYLLTLCKVYIKNGDKCGALDSAVRAYTLTFDEGENPYDILQLIREIDKMH